MRSWFRLSDRKDKAGGRVQISQEEAMEWNKKKWGVYWTVNQFQEGTEKFTKDKVEKILAWFCELDGDKETLEAYLRTIPLYPSAIIESKNGYHLYWKAENGTIENYDNIQNRIQHTVSKADRNCKDIARILRVPGYNHWKDEEDPFMVEIYANIGNAYTEDMMTAFFESPPEREKAPREKDKEYRDYFHCKDALQILSGTDFVRGDKYTFSRNSDGSHQLIVNGKSTACWVDSKGMIGSHDNGGPTIYQWLKWYKLDKIKMAEAMQLLKRSLDKCITG